MKILMFSYSYGSVTTTFIRNEVFYFSKKHNLTYLAQKVEDHQNKIKTHIIHYAEPIIKKKINWFLWQMDMKCSFKNKKYAKQLNDFISKEKPDIIHCHFAYEALPLLENISEEFKTPIFVHFHGYDASQMLRKKSYVSVLKKHINKNITPIVVSEKMKSVLMESGINMSNSRLLRYGIDLEKFKINSTRENNREEIIFLQNSSLTEKKGHEYSLKAFALFLNNHPTYKNKLKIIFTGDGIRKKMLQQYSTVLGIEKNTYFIGNVNQNQLIELLINADVFIHHSITAQNGDEEGIPNAIMEAMAMELPVLSTFHAGIPELVKNGINGFLCNEKDVETYSSQIAQIIQWNKLPNNRVVIETEFDMIKHNQKLEEYYKEAINRNLF